MKKYIVYQIINKINNKIYIGCHTTKNINDSYMGSGKKIKLAIKKYGFENFEKIILFQFDNKEDMLDKEAELVNNEFVIRPDTYNISLGGGYLNFLDKVSVKDIDGNTMIVNKTDPKYLSSELKHINNNKVIVKDKSGNTFITDKNDPKYISGELDFLWKDRKHSDETKKKMSESSKGQCLGDKNGSYRTCWITNNNENKKIKKEELENYILQGWSKGRKIKK